MPKKSQVELVKRGWWIGKNEIDALERLSESTGAPVSELVRRALREYLSKDKKE